MLLCLILMFRSDLDSCWQEVCTNSWWTIQIINDNTPESEVYIRSYSLTCPKRASRAPRWFFAHNYFGMDLRKMTSGILSQMLDICHGEKPHENSSSLPWKIHCRITMNKSIFDNIWYDCFHYDTACSSLSITNTCNTCNTCDSECVSNFYSQLC